MKKLFASLGLMFALLSPGMTLAQDAVAPVEEAVAVEAAEAVAVEAPMAEAVAPAEAAPAAEAAAPVPDKGDTTWMMVSTIIVIMMTIPGLALFYGGLVRAKNMLSVLTQVLAIFCLISILWVVYGYSLAFGDGGSLNWAIGDLSKMFLAGITADSTAATFSDGVVIPEYIFVAFQLTFAAITVALITGGLAERVKFSALLVFGVLWFTFSYLPITHMVWATGGYLFEAGDLDFAGGTVVHINSGIAALVGALVLGKRIGYGRDAMPPHSLPMTLIGASLLWVGWFGFNAGSNLEANGGTTLAFINTVLAPAAAGLAWMFAEWLLRGKPSMLGLASGVVAGLVAVTPAAGLVGPMGAIVLGAVAGVICLWGVTSLKKMLGYDDSLDVFGIHGIGGIVGAIGTGIFVSPALGGVGVDGYAMGSQVITQATGVIITIVWSGVVSFVAFKLIDMTMGLRVSEEQEREGLDTASHGERAYSA
ncbi:MAG: ammonia channel protein [Hydrogenophilales bacterium 16-64-46]|nr:MAG: ammonia channel protein [Hydrogenophilales bacterium 12-64-13]OYZ05828.1 MAG: ammonia channel protein [Hydrogenophilales bacterium 16-64-46]OZA39763.1 MAG: ammonia channel protein [Hydrogenophilales bacterium 17-64-34]HQS98696.1 ammonium transporter [Thiobacillus sp.]